MPADEEVIRASNTEGAPPELNQIKKNTSAVIEDHRQFKETQARLADSVKPPSFEHCLEVSYSMTPQPIPEEEVQRATEQAVESFVQERDSAGGRVLDPDAVPLEESSEGEMEPVEYEQEPSEDVEPGDAPTQASRPVAHVATLPGPDFYALAQELEERLARRLEGRLGEMGGAIAGLGFRIDRIVLRAEKPGLAEQSPREMPLATPVPVPAAPAKRQSLVEPAGDPPHSEVKTLQERRKARQAPSGGTQGLSGQEDGEVPSAGTEMASGPAWRPSARLVRLRISRKALKQAASLLLILGGVAASGTMVFSFLSGRPRAYFGHELTEKQVQGFGAYVRTEEALLSQESRRCDRLEELVKVLRTQNQSVLGEKHLENERRISEVDESITKFQRARKALQALYEISGVTPAQ